ncbi:hypothetical protein Taro_025269 [Colocasia esculenta]|uniref:Uncharacterized protein n=1 Tax=Colocasia esculenta TaxID=4460 RepID=A0A843VDR8_COLES|nr:hypothetical protein [Colocasia esculenta]
MWLVFGVRVRFWELTGLTVWARCTPGFSVYDRDSRGCRVLNVTLLPVAFLLPLCGADRLHVHHILGAGRPADVSLRRRCPGPSRSGRDGTIRRVLNRKRNLKPAGRNRAQHALFGQGEVLRGFPGVFRCGSLWRGMFSPWEARVEWEKRRGIAVLCVFHGGSTTPTVVTSPVGCPSFSVSQVVSSGLVPFTASVLVYGLLELEEFPTEPVTSEAHPYSPQVKARRRFRYHLPVQGRDTAVLGQRLQQCSFRSSVVTFLSHTSSPRGQELEELGEELGRSLFSTNSPPLGLYSSSSNLLA